MHRRLCAWGTGLLVGVLAVTSLGGGAASAVAGAAEVPDGTHPFVAKITFGDLRSCTGALVAPRWVVTAKECFTDGATPVTDGAPLRPTDVSIGRTDVSTTAGHRRAVVSVAPHPDRNLALAQLSAPVTGIRPIAFAAAAAQAGETLTVAGYGRRAT